MGHLSTKYFLFFVYFAYFYLDMSVVPVENMPIQNGLIAWPVALLLSAFWRSAHTENFTLDAALSWFLSSTPAMTKMWSCRCVRNSSGIGLQSGSQVQLTGADWTDPKSFSHRTFSTTDIVKVHRILRFENACSVIAHPFPFWRKIKDTVFALVDWTIMPYPTYVSL